MGIRKDLFMEKEIEHCHIIPRGYGAGFRSGEDIATTAYATLLKRNGS